MIYHATRKSMATRVYQLVCEGFAWFSDYGPSLLRETTQGNLRGVFVYECIYSRCSLADLVFVNLPTCQHLFVTSKSILVVLSRSVADMCRVVKTQSSEGHVSIWDWARWCSAFLFSSHTVNKCPFPGVFSPVFSTFFVLVWLAISLFNMVPKHSVA